MHFEQHVLHEALFGGFVIDGLQQSYGVHGLDEVGTHLQQVPHFIGLQMSDEMPMDISRQGRYFLLQFLYTALTEVPFSRLIRFTNRLYGVKLTHAHECHARGYLCAHVPYLFCNHCA